MQPQTGHFVEVRRRPWLVESTHQLERDLTTVKLSCIADDAQGEQLEVVWESEVDAQPLAEDAWTRIAENGTDDAATFAAYLRCMRWKTATAAERDLFQAPFRAGIRLESYQLQPLLKALRLPRVNLMLADDVGLGKTVEAGLILREMLLRRRVDYILVGAPPAMTIQWQEELEEKFGLSFTIIDREKLADLRRQRGFGVNPWMTGSRFIISHALLSDESYMAGLRDVLGEFGSRAMLILDEAHHAAPASGQLYAVESQFTRAVREISGRFQHRLFLTATPHNGHSNSFTALLEMLDPQRFTRGVEVRPKDLEPIMVRRLKEDLRKLGSTFPRRLVDPVILDGLDEDEPELKLSRMLADYGDLREQRIRHLKRREAAQAKIAFVGLQQRLLSSVAAFAKTLNVHRESLRKVRDRVATQAANTEAAEAFVATPDEAVATLDTDDETGALEDLAKEEDAATEAATELGAKEAETAALDRELTAVDEMLEVANRYRSRPDARVRRLCDWIREHMHESGGWNRRRLILFTEYEDTRRWLEARLKEELDDFGDIDDRIDTFTGITSSDRRETIKHAFNADPGHHALRILICTDAAREGINLQAHCYDLFHIDLPWNPSRLEQRNGRIDRKLQPANEVYCRYFKYSQRETDIVLDALVRKTDRIQRQLGSVGKVVEERISNRLLEAGIARGKAKELSELIEEENAEDLHARAKREMEPSDEDRLEKLRKEHDHLRNILERSRKTVGVEPADLRHVVGTALNRAGLSLPKHETESVNDVRTFQLDPTNPVFANDPRWQETLDDLRERRPKRREKLSRWRKDAQVRKIAFEPPVQEDGADADDVVQVHLEHRLVRRLLSRFISQGFQSGLERVCAVIGPGAEPRVVMVGRLAVFGPGASRLHEEFITVTARWREAERAQNPLTPYGRQGEQTTFEQLEEALRNARDVPHNVAERLREYAPQDAQELDPELQKRAEARLAEVKKDLAKRGDEEAKTLTQLLEQQRKRIERAQAANDPRQTEFKFPNDAERRQFEQDRQHWERRRQRIETELEAEPARVRTSYEPKAHRLEAIGLLYLWPRTG